MVPEPNLTGFFLEPNLAAGREVLTRLNMCLPFNPAVVFLSIHLNELKTYVHIEPACG